ncbi:MAG TPA: DUF4230 domain-containing protein, partial [Blastocatellia bacterium]|nr:DUF4230 domain-containing protein [Blastocatellia bacterium]
VWMTILLVAGALLIVGAVMMLQRATQNLSVLNRPHETTISHSLVMQKIQSVAKLVSSEATMRDVVVFEDTWYGSTKRSLVVVTGKVLAGINLDRSADVKIDDTAKRISITLPNATVMAVDITEMKTYDEQSGLWNAFAPADRDRIYQQARKQIEEAGRQAQLVEHANKSAKQLLESMFTRDGYSAEVNFYEPLP